MSSLSRRPGSTIVLFGLLVSSFAAYACQPAAEDTSSLRDRFSDDDDDDDDDDDSPEGRRRERGDLESEVSRSDAGRPQNNVPAKSDASTPPSGGCVDDFDCPIAQICQSSACVPGCNQDYDCATGDVCTSGQCTKGTTTTPPAGSSCAADTECDLGEICVSSACTPGCYTEYDCPVGETCESGQCSK